VCIRRQRLQRVTQGKRNLKTSITRAAAGGSLVTVGRDDFQYKSSLNREVPVAPSLLSPFCHGWVISRTLPSKYIVFSTLWRVMTWSCARYKILTSCLFGVLVHGLTRFDTPRALRITLVRHVQQSDINDLSYNPILNVTWSPPFLSGPRTSHDGDLWTPQDVRYRPSRHLHSTGMSLD
jgi:hypothetical protein